MNNKRIYFDNAASTEVDARVISAMTPYHDQFYANASSLHMQGTESKFYLEQARKIIADSVNANSEEVFFTSGGTESNNLAIKGIAFKNLNKGGNIIISSIEHDCIINSCKWLKNLGFDVIYLPVDSEGIVDIDNLKSNINKKTILVSVMHANNEIGSIQPIKEIGDICSERKIPFHSDACQSYGKMDIDVRGMNIDLLTINSHKIYGPKGVGALIKRKGIEIEPLFHGGGHEQGLRSSTENIPGIMGFAEAVKLCMNEKIKEEKRLIYLRDMLIDGILDKVPEAYLNGHRTKRLCSNINIAFSGYEGEGIRLLLLLDKMGYAVSTGSACSGNDAENNPSHVLTSIGRNQIQARGALRISLGRYNTEEEVKDFLIALPEAIKQLNLIFSIY